MEDEYEPAPCLYDKIERLSPLFVTVYTNAKKLNIVLANGDTLTNLMIKYHIDIEIKQQFTMYKIARDWFE